MEIPLTPCVQICDLNEHGVCVGCARTIDEIVEWGSMSQAERAAIMAELLPARRRAMGLPPAPGSQGETCAQG